MAPVKKAAEVDPDRLKRERAGRYVTADGRFAVEGPGTNGWYVVDSERENELGLPLIRGPYATLDDARAVVADLRAAPDSTPAPPVARPEPGDGEAPAHPRARPRAGEGPAAKPDPHVAGAATTPRQSRRPAAPPRAGPRGELAREVRRLALAPWNDPTNVERELAQLEKRVPRHLRPAVADDMAAAKRTVRRVAAEDLAALARVVALRTAAGVFDALELEGRAGGAAGERGWRLIELDGRREPTDRALVMAVSDLLEPPEA